jgi:hypothetical protein
MKKSLFLCLVLFLFVQVISAQQVLNSLITPTNKKTGVSIYPVITWWTDCIIGTSTNNTNFHPDYFWLTITKETQSATPWTYHIKISMAQQSHGIVYDTLQFPLKIQTVYSWSVAYVASPVPAYQYAGDSIQSPTWTFTTGNGGETSISSVVPTISKQVQSTFHSNKMYDLQGRIINVTSYKKLHNLQLRNKSLLF